MDRGLGVEVLDGDSQNIHDQHERPHWWKDRPGSNLTGNKVSTITPQRSEAPTLDYDMATIPELIRTVEQRSIDSSCFLPVGPVGPVLTVVPRVTEHISAVSSVSEQVFATRVG